ncbi:MAG: hypothetical protein PHW96_04620 [Candidatus Nanoarchaeia archaeon]|nr:hypothetical protein [Candidatus Nanoarchaeia archaeon]
MVSVLIFVMGMLDITGAVLLFLYANATQYLNPTFVYFFAFALIIKGIWSAVSSL